MRYEDRDDTELVELAQAGWAPAFAVLVHRHAPLVFAATDDDRDPYRASLDVFVRALRRLPDRDPQAPFGSWLLRLAARPMPATVSRARTTEVDALWRELHARWPDGRLPRRVPRFLKRVATAVAAIAIGVAVPAAVLTAFGPADENEEEATELRAQPIGEPTPEPTEDPAADREPLSTFEFPDVRDAPAAPAPFAPPTGPRAAVEGGP
jgi:DNA-directed RNA polymerase specialized sigma24 family protein